MILLSISGCKYSGKTTTAELISKQFNHSSFILGWADAVKEEVSKATGTPVLIINTQKERFRPVLQWWGTEFRRKENPNYWINKLMPKINECDREICIIHDTRFINELEWVKSMGGVCVRVVRKDKNSADDKHTSEHDLDDSRFDYTIVNNGDINDLERYVTELTNKLKRKN